MRGRWIGLPLALLVAGGAAGYGLGALDDTTPVTFAEPRPVVAQSPSIPVDPSPSFAADITYPPLERGLEYVPQRIGDPPYQWRYDVPRGWRPEPVGALEVRWRPADEPTIGGYSLRVKVVNEHRTDAEMVAQKAAAVQSIYDDVDVVGRSDDLLSFRYRDGTGRQRFDTFMWFTRPGGSTAEFEMSVVGRAADQDGLEDLLDHVAASIEKLPAP